MLRKVQKTIKLTVQGLKSIDMTPRSDYWRYVSTPKDISERSWKATGAQMREAISTVGGTYAPK